MARALFAALWVLCLCSFGGALLRPSKANAEGRSGPAVFAMACGYDKAAIAPFLVTLRATGYIGAVHMGVGPSLASETQRFLEAMSVTSHTEPCNEQARGGVLELALGFAKQTGAVPRAEAGELLPRPPMFGSLNQRRYNHYRQWLLLGNYSKVWFLDVRDVIFQADPFSIPLPAGTEIAVFRDDKEVSGWELRRVNDCLDPKLSLDMKGMPNFCGGAILTTGSGAMQLCDKMIGLLEKKIDSARKLPHCAENDQPFLNALAFSNGLNKTGTQGNWSGYKDFHGAATNVGHFCIKMGKQMSRNGTLLNKDGTVVPVIHKYDACIETQQIAKRLTR